MKAYELESRLSKITAEAKSEARFILEELFGVSYSELVLNKDREYDSERLNEVLFLREQGEPLQYILGKWYFMDSSFVVSPKCLIPRADTEILVYEAIRLLKNEGCVADLCTGSGCIGLSMLKHRGDISSAVLADISSDALEVAVQNARALGVYDKCIFINCDITKGLPEGKLDMIVSNPPYIPTSDIETLSKEVKREPRLALDGGDDGLDIIRPLVDLAPNSLNKDGYLLIEFGYDQEDAISALMDEKVKSGAYKSYKILKDYGGNPRVLVAQV